jgi:dTMP kinase
MSSSSSTSPKRGFFILFEGVDRSGKTTQAQKLAEYMNEHVTPTEFIRFPNRDTSIGRMINAYLAENQDLSDETIHLLFSANRWEAKQSILDKLNEGVSLVCDRYAFSGIAFTAAKGLDLGWCRSCDVGLPSPDLVLFLDLTIEQAKARGDFGLERYEKEDFQRKVREQFLRLQEEELRRMARGEEEEGKEGEEEGLTWLTLSANTTIEALHDEIKTVADREWEAFNQKQEEQGSALPVSSLWT